MPHKLGIFILIAVTGVIASGRAVTGATIVWKSGTSHNFGEVKQNSVVMHRFEFTNSGKDTLHIGTVRTSCGCTAAMVSAAAIAPGATGTIEAKFNTRGRKGPQQKSITIETSADRNDDIVLQLKATILVPYPTTPDYIRFSECVVGRSDTVAITLMNKTAKSIQIGQPFSSDPHITLSLNKNDLGPGEQAVVTAVILPDASMVKQFIGTATLPLVAADVPVLNIPVLVSSRP